MAEKKKKKGLDYSSWKTKNGNSVSSQKQALHCVSGTMEVEAKSQFILRLL